MTDAELKEKVVRNVDQTNQLKAERKAFSAGIRDTIKELDTQNAAILEELDSRAKAAGVATSK